MIRDDIINTLYVSSYDMINFLVFRWSLSRHHPWQLPLRLQKSKGKIQNSRANTEVVYTKKSFGDTKNVLEIYDVNAIPQVSF